MNQCKICGERLGDELFSVKEQMLGLAEPFEYAKCPFCRCLQLLSPPQDMSPYYPTSYYSLKKLSVKGAHSIKDFLRHKRAQWCISGKGFLGKIVSRLSLQPSYYEWLRNARIGFDDEILDVGSGSGSFLLSLRKEGFSKLTGIDPYINEDIVYDCGVRILKRRITELHQRYDFIVLNHSLEHFVDPKNTLSALHGLLNPGKYLLIRTPVVPSYAFEKYRENWVQIDAPRHFFIFSEKAIAILAEQTGFSVKKTIYDSTEFQFWGSEQYQKGISLLGNRSYSQNPGKSIFTEKEISDFRKKAIKLNERSQGDQAAFFLCRKL